MATTFVTDFTVDELQAAEKSLKNFIFIQLDDDLSVSSTSWVKPTYERQDGGYKIELYVALQKIPQYVYRFHNVEDCLTCLRSVRDYGVILIISRSETMNNETKSMLMTLPHVLSIYVYGHDIPWQKLWGNVTEGIDPEIPPTKFASTVSAPKLDKPSQLFVMHQLLSELVLHIPRTAQSKFDFLISSLKIFGHDPQVAREIHRFEQAYASDQAIWWFTSNVFIYRLFNRTCHFDKPNAIYKIRFYITDLVEQMKTLHHVQRSTILPADVLRVYRGKLMSREDLNRLMKNKDKLHILTRFLLTVIRKEVALLYSGDSRIWNTDFVSVIFDIQIAMKQDISQSIALVREHSSIPEENEVLLPMGLLFRMQSIQQVKEKLWEIKLVSEESFGNSFRQQAVEADNFLNMTNLLQDIHDNQPISSIVEPIDHTVLSRLSIRNHNDEEDMTARNPKWEHPEETNKSGWCCC